MALIVFLGGIASGKTTYRALAKEYLGNHGFLVISHANPPFSGFTYLALMFIVTLTSLRRPTGHPLARLEVLNRVLLSKVLRLAILLDLLQLIIATMAYRVLDGLSRTVLILEDSLPVILLDHLTYYLLYRNHGVSKDKVLLTLYRVVLSNWLSLEGVTLCVYLRASARMRYLRSIKRGYRIVNAAVPHDRLRGGFLISIARKLCGNVTIINTESKISRLGSK